MVRMNVPHHTKEPPTNPQIVYINLLFLRGFTIIVLIQEFILQSYVWSSEGRGASGAHMGQFIQVHH